MIYDLEHLAGFPLCLDTDRMDISTGPGIHFQRAAHRRQKMEKVLRQPEALPEDAEIYWTFNLQPAGSFGQIFDHLAMTFGLVLLPPLLIGDEFVKSHGHYHSAMPGISTGYSEVYTHYFGKLYLYMQRRLGDAPAVLDDCVLYEMVPGCSIQIPPGYAHILINPSDQPALMAGLYSQRAEHVYAPIQAMRGGAYHLIRQGSQDCFVPNPHYEQIPDLQPLTETAGTHFEAPNGCQPLWKAFLDDPARYAFIYDPEAAIHYYAVEDQRL